MTEPKLTATVTKPLYATVGAGDALYATVLDVVSQIRERANSADVQGRIEEARERFANLPADLQEQAETLRQRVQALPSELPEDLAELREKATPEELRKLVDQYYHQLLDLYADLAARGEETVEKLRANPAFEERFEQVESRLNDIVSQTQDILNKATEQVGPYIGLAGKDEEAPAEEAVDAEVVDVTTETAPVEDEAPKKAAPAKKAPAKKAPAKKAAPAAKK
ncbi:heparin-binding hemagglutinin [Nocardia sp. ET3-3]|uniref:Heparin-binding hemagglutinin n=1 Tax=Nocardia terrae TaxID=2675851 RepID=A0A7K1VAA1_9NOCA|nr:heparin-binding hemagglutinin [Nocardia terrae]MVU83580.1 heparin-binding hemagglutinin [Nocardia terrae]